MGSCVLVTDLVEHMIEESSKAFKNTKHEDDWVFFHDALSLMRAKSCKIWMEKRGYLKRWILPSSDLFEGYPDLNKKYGGHPCGNSPEYNPWDLRLNQTVHKEHDNHVRVTSSLPDGHPKNSLARIQELCPGHTVAYLILNLEVSHLLNGGYYRI